MAKQQSMLVSISSINHEDLSNWELINQSDDDNDSLFGVQSFDLSESIHSLSSSDLDDDHDDADVHDLPIMDDVVHDDKVDELDVGLINCVVNCEKYDKFDLGLSNFVVNCEKDDKFDAGLDKFDVGSSNFGVINHGYNDYDDYVEEDDEDGEDGDDIDDELVPWEVKDVYVRQRIKKSGKKSMTKMDKSRKFLRCVKGKYGYGAALKPY